MRYALKLPILVACAVLAGTVLAGTVSADELSRSTTWKQPSFEAVRDEVKTHVAEQIAADEPPEDAAALAALDALWADDSEAEAQPLMMLDAVARSVALVEPRAQELLDYCARPATDYHPPAFEWLREEGLSPLVANNLRLYYGRWLAQNKYYDESLVQVAELTTDDVVDPATLLFVQGLNGHRLLDKELGLKALADLLKNQGQIPRRYEVLAGLMQSDLKNMEDASLNHISRQMEDVERRLALGRAGKTVQIPEDEALDNLDKLIKQLEEQRKKQQQQSSGPANGIQSNGPASDSIGGGGLAPGEVDRRDIGEGGAWGNLPPKEREKTLQDIGRDFPAHYRDTIEEFFREQAKLHRQP